MQYTLTEEELGMVLDWSFVADHEGQMSDCGKELQKKIRAALAPSYFALSVEDKFVRFLLENKYSICTVWPANSRAKYFKFSRDGKPDLMIPVDGMSVLSAIRQVIEYFE